MPRKHHSISDLLLQAPWWVSVVTAAIVYIVMGFIIPSIETNNQFLDIVFNAVAVPAPFFSIVFLFLAPLSFLNSRRKIELLNQQTNLNSIRKLHWKNFEELVAEAYRRLGYQVTEGGFGPDGGIDLELRKDGEVSLVQCKNWKTQKVGVNVIREMYGVLAASNATQINIICSGKFTHEAYSFAADKPIFLVSGNELEALIRDIQSPVTKSEEGGEIGASIGSYNFKRVQGDYSMLLSEDGSWAARVVASVEDKESHLDGLENDRSFVYGVIDGQLTDNATVTFGLSYQDANTDGNTWGGLVFNYTDGTQAEWDISDTTSQDWTKWNTETTNAFVELDYVFDNDWQLLLSYNYRDFEDQSKLFYAYGAIDKDTGLGLVGWPGRYDSERDSHLVEGRVFGDFSLFGRNHEVTFGVSHATSDDVSFVHAFDYATTPAYGPTPAFPYALDAIAEPEWLAASEYSNIEQTLTRYFGSARFSVTDEMHIIAGFNAIDFERTGQNAGAVIDNSESEASPYVGATYAVTEDINAYVSYSDVYQPQEQYDINGQYLDPTKGQNFEAGVKAQWFDDRLLTTFAYFTAEQDNLAAYAGTNPDTLQFYYKGVSVESNGFEIEVAGQVTDALRVNASYTNIDVEDEQGNDANLWAPRDVVTFQLGYYIPQAPEVEVGFGGRWQSEISNVDYNVEQGAYFLGNVYASRAFTEDITVRMNINNIFDKKYINSLHTVGYYGAGINAQLSASYTF